MKHLKLAIVDVETTGGGSSQDRIIEIAIIRIENGKITRTYESLVNPQRSLSAMITELTGITDNDLENAPTFAEIRDEVHEILKDCVFVAHNVGFDYSFIRKELKEAGIAFYSTHMCTVRLSRKLYPRHKRHNLDAVMKRCSISIQRRHRALDDAKAVWDFICHSHKKFPERISDAITTVTREHKAPQGYVYEYE